MTPQDMIDRYVQDVARRLPQPMRADVAVELRALITEGLRERANGGESTEQQAAEFLVAMGAPATLALSYSPPLAIIDPIDARLFGKLASGLLIALGVLAASVVLAAPHESRAEWTAIAAAVAQSYGATALQVLGLLLVIFWIAGDVRRRHPHIHAWKPASLPPVRDPDAINRAGNIAAIAAWTLGFLVLMYPVAAFDIIRGGPSPQALRDAFTYDEAFAHERAPLLWCVLGLSLIVQAWVTIEGRYRKLTRGITLALTAVFCLVSVWAIGAGPIFVAAPTDETMKLGMAIIAGFSAVEVWRQLRGEMTARMPELMSI